ncbi:MAG: hypothetical protein AAF411_22620 [Myxococcota bacterium]
MRPVLLCLTFALACSSDAGFYEACSASETCTGDATCTVVAFEVGRTGAMCTAECVVDEDCPRAGSCFELVGDPVEGKRVCYQPCLDDFDCDPGFTCADATMTDPDTGQVRVVDQICLPL